MTLPIHLAVHYLGCATRADGSVRVPSLLGPYLECLAENVDRLTVVASESPPDPVLEDLADYPLAATNVDLFSLGPKGTWRDRSSRRRTIAATLGPASEAWDVLLLRLPNRRVRDVSDANRCPRVVTLTGGHTPSVVAASPLGPKAKLRALIPALIAERDIKHVMRKSALAFANSESLIRQYKRSVPHVELLRTSNRRARFSHAPADRLEGDAVELLVSGRITWGKGVLEAVDVLARVKRRWPAARLHVVGSGDALEPMRAHAERLGVADSVVFHGWMQADERLFALYAKMDVLLLLSSAEGFPRVVWEALGHGVLVVTTRVGGLEDAFADGRELLFVPVGDAVAAADAVLRLKEDPEVRRRLINAGGVRARESELEVIVERFLARLDERWPELASR